MADHADAIILGAGTLGCSVAYQLSKRGCKVLVLERRDTACGTAGASGSLVDWFASTPGYRCDLFLESKALFPSIQEELGNIGLKAGYGTVQVIATETEKDLAERTIAENSREGMEVSIVGIQEARKLEPSISPAMWGAIYVPDVDYVDPIKLAFAFRRGATRLGARFQNDTQVNGMIFQGDRVVGVRTNRGDYQADIVVNCAGAWSGLVAEMAGLSFPIIPKRGQMLISEPVAPFCNAMITSSVFQTVLHHPELISDERVKRYRYSFAIEQTDTGTAIICGTREDAGLDEGVTPDVIEMIARNACRIIPRLKDLHFIRAFAGLRPCSSDDNPLIGPVDGVPGFFMCSGHGGEGVSLAPITGKLVAEYILEGAPSYDISCLSPNRFLPVNA